MRLARSCSDLANTLPSFIFLQIRIASLPCTTITLMGQLCHIRNLCGSADLIRGSLIRQNHFGITAKFPVIMRSHSSRITALVIIAPAGLLKISEAIHHGKEQLLTEICLIWPFPSPNRVDMRLLLANIGPFHL